MSVSSTFHLQVDDSNDMWEDQEEEEEEEEDGLAGQLLSDILATSKYGKPFEKRQNNMVNTFSVHTGAKNGVPKQEEMWAYKGYSLGFCPFCLSHGVVNTTRGLILGLCPDSPCVGYV